MALVHGNGTRSRNAAPTAGRKMMACVTSLLLSVGASRQAAAGRANEGIENLLEKAGDPKPCVCPYIYCGCSSLNPTCCSSLAECCREGAGCNTCSPPRPCPRIWCGCDKDGTNACCASLFPECRLGSGCYSCEDSSKLEMIV